jgi:excinuclease ABC subunit C
MQDIKKSRLRSDKIATSARQAPSKPGIYIMKGKKGRVIYVGKAASLKRRLASHFARPDIDSRHAAMISETRNADWQTAPSVIEALILESRLIKKYNPKYNVKDKDNKTFLHVVFTNEKYPRVMLTRESELHKIFNFQFPISKQIPNSKAQTSKSFGPFTNASAIRAALDILRKIFPYRDCPKFPRRPCLQYHLKRCGAPCAGLISKDDYNKNIKNLILFFEGNKKKILRNLKKEMLAASKNQEFEKAATLRNQIFALKHIEDVAVTVGLTKPYKLAGLRKPAIRIEGYDISNIGKSFAVGSMVVFENGKPAKPEYKKFRIRTVAGQNDIAMIKEILRRRLNHKEWPFPNLILVDGGLGQVNAANSVLKDFGFKIPVVGIAKGADRKKDEFITPTSPPYLKGELEGVTRDMLLRVRNEAHRFAQKYHKFLREKI